MNPLYLGQALPQNQQDRNDQESPATGRYSEGPRGRKRHQRPNSRRLHNNNQVDGKEFQNLEPETPTRGVLQNVSRRREGRPPPERILQSATRISREFLASPWKSVRHDEGVPVKHEHNDEDQTSSSRVPRVQGRRPGLTPLSPTSKPFGRSSASKKYKSNPPRHRRRSSQVTNSPASHQDRQSHKTQEASPVHIGDTQDTNKGSSRSVSDLSDLEGNLKISKMNGLLDIWDSTGNPNWDKEVFALCDLGYCNCCRRYYVPLRTLGHVCRRRTHPVGKHIKA